MRLSINERQWLWVAGDKSVAVVSSRAGDDDTLILVEGDEAMTLWDLLRKEVDVDPSGCNGNLVIMDLPEWGVISSEGTPERRENSTDALGSLTKVTVKKVRLKELLPEELRLLSATAGKSGENQTNGCSSAACSFAATGCAYDVKLHYHILGV